MYNHEPNKIFRDAKEFNISRLACSRMRLRFLQEEVNRFLEKGDAISYYWCTEALKEMASITKQAYLCHEKKISKLDITPEDIERARSYPVEQLVKFERGKALAWCHADSSPSLTLNKKHNRCHCFVCNRSMDSITVVRELHGYNFVEAVKFLR